MSEALSQYHALLRKLVRVRWKHEGYESAEEDDFLEEMDEVWWKLSEAERELVNAEKPRSLLRYGLYAPPRDVDVRSAEGSPVRLFREGA